MRLEPETSDAVPTVRARKVLSPSGPASAASPLKEAWDNAQKAVETQRPGIITYIGENWDDIEYYFRHEEPASLRRKAREWGVTYKSRPGEPEEPEDPTPPPPTPPPA